MLRSDASDGRGGVRRGLVHRDGWGGRNGGACRRSPEAVGAELQEWETPRPRERDGRFPALAQELLLGGVVIAKEERVPVKVDNILVLSGDG